MHAVVAPRFLDDVIASGAWIEPRGHPLEYDVIDHPIPAFFDRSADDGTDRTPLREAAPDQSWLVIKSEECYCACTASSRIISHVLPHCHPTDACLVLLATQLLLT